MQVLHITVRATQNFFFPALYIFRNGPLSVLRCVRLSRLTPCESQFKIRTSCDMQRDSNNGKEHIQQKGYNILHINVSASFASVGVNGLSTCSWVVTTEPPGNIRRCASVIFEQAVTPSQFIFSRWHLDRMVFSFCNHLLHSLQLRVQLRLLSMDSNL